MIFKLLKYLQPTHYFSRKNKQGKSVFPIPEKLPDHIFEQLQLDDKYKSDQAKKYDLSWQAVQKGYIGDVETYKSFDKLPIFDEYRFVKKNFSKAWVIYVLACRLLGLNNPLKEIWAFYKTWRVERVNLENTPIKHKGWQDFQSELVTKKPFVSVIIPTLNRYEYLKDVLVDLQNQSYRHFEVIVIDQSRPFREGFYRDFKLDLQVIFQEEKALWLARNKAIKQAKGDYILLFDDDSRVASDWVSLHLKCLDYFKADMSSGVSISKEGAKVPKHYNFFRLSDQLDTGNVMIKKDLFKTTGLFDRQFEKQRMGDGEFGFRAYREGFINISNPFAKRLHLKVESGGLREMGSWDAFRTKKWFAPKPIPSVLYFFRKDFGAKAAKRALWRTVPMSVLPYKYKSNKILLISGVLWSICIWPIVAFQVLKSWRIATIKLKQGPLIESFSE